MRLAGLLGYVLVVLGGLVYRPGFAQIQPLERESALGTAGAQEAVARRPPDFNHIASPQFRVRWLNPNFAFNLKNGGLGRGGNSDSYFCGGEDESSAYRGLHGDSSGLSPNNPLHRGSYDIYQLEDACQTEGCGGGLIPDNFCTYLAVPRYAANCHPWTRGVWDQEIYQRNPSTSEVPGTASPRTVGHPGWQERNFVDDRFGFIYGRYLVTQAACNLESSAVAAAVGLELDSQEYNALQQSDHHYADLPFSREHLAWGFTCPAIGRAGGYAISQHFQEIPAAPVPIGLADDQFLSTHRQLLEHAKNRIPRDLRRGRFGNFEEPNTSEQAMAEAVVNAWHVLEWGLGHTAWEPCLEGLVCAIRRTGEIFGRIFGWGAARGPIEFHLARGLSDWPVEYDHESNRIYFSTGLSDCHAKRAKDSHSHFNVSGTHHPDGRCFASYGEWRDGGLFEPFYEQQRGFELVVERNDTHQRPGGYRPAGGYAPFVTAQIAHQICHAYQRQSKGTNHMAGWPSLEASWEEALCVQTEALVYTNLCRLGFCPSDFKMQKEDFVRAVQFAERDRPASPVIGAERGERYSYPNICRGFSNRFLGAWCATVLNIAETLRENRKPLEAKLLSLLKAQAPNLVPPDQMCLNGSCQAFELPAVTHPSPGIELYDQYLRYLERPEERLERELARDPTQERFIERQGGSGK